MADVATVFHWSPVIMDPMPLVELMRWRALAIDRFEQTQPKG